MPFSARYLLFINNRVDFICLGLLKGYSSPDFSVLKNKQLSDGALKESCEGLQRLMCLHVGDNNFRSILTDPPAALTELGTGSGSTLSIAEQAWTPCGSLQRSRLTHQPFTKAVSLRNVFAHDEDELESTEEHAFPQFSPLPLRNYILQPVEYQ